MKRCFIIMLVGLFTAIVFATAAHAHGVIGKRFIPSTLTLEDPFPSDEMDLLTFERCSKNKEARETSVGFEFSKRLTPEFALGVGWQYLFVEPREAEARCTLGGRQPGIFREVFFFSQHRARNDCPQVYAYDGELIGMFESKQGILNGVRSGQHTLELRVVAEDHQTELDATDCVEFFVK